MTALKSSFFDKVLGRIDRLHTDGLQTVVQRLARERSFLETLYNTIQDGILVVEKSGRLIYHNEAAVTFLGLPAETIEGQPVSRYLPALDWGQLRAATGSQRVVRHEFDVDYPQPRFLRLYAAPIESEALGPGGVVIILHDATEARQQTFDAIESERVQALTLLAASVAHEIGNPLNALNIHLQLMERELRKLKPVEGGRRAGGDGPSLEVVRGVTGRFETYLGVAKGEITRLDYIVTQFLQAIRPTALRRQMTLLNEVVRATLELLKPELENRGLTVQEELVRSLPLAPVDPAQFKQVLVNLIKNAMQAMTRGGQLAVATGQASDGVWVSIGDTGGGISPEKINRLFEPHYTTKAKGTGLGLMIVQRIVREHGGRIEVESRVGQGTTFRVWLPLQERQPRLLKAPAKP